MTLRPSCKKRAGPEGPASLTGRLSEGALEAQGEDPSGRIIRAYFRLFRCDGRHRVASFADGTTLQRNWKQDRSTTPEIWRVERLHRARHIVIDGDDGGVHRHVRCEGVKRKSFWVGEKGRC